MNKIYNHYKFDYLMTSNYDNYEEIVDKKQTKPAKNKEEVVVEKPLQ